MIELNKIYNVDCLEGMAEIQDGSVDCIICDLPYGTTACKWDCVIPFEKLWEHYRRVIKETGAILLFGAEPFSTKLRCSQMDLYKYDWYWVKKKANGFQHAKNRPLMGVECVSVFSKSPMGHKSLLGSRRMQYNPQGVKENGERTITEKVHGRTMGERPRQVGVIYKAFKGYPSNVLYYDNVWGANAMHPTQKPVDLLRYLIRTYTTEGETILDNCMGSGTTAVACILEKRNFIGFELNKEYCDISNERINKLKREPTLF